MLTRRKASQAGWPARWKAAPPQPRRVLGSPSWGPPAPAYSQQCADLLSVL